MTLEPEERRTLIEHRLKRADETLSEAVLLFENGKLPAAVNRVYYGMYYALNALAVSEGFKTGKHAQLIGWFNKNWIRTKKVDPLYSKILFQAFDKRMLGDYSDMPEFSETEVNMLITQCADFIAMIRKLLEGVHTPH